MLLFIANVPLKHGPNKNIGYAIDKIFWMPRAKSNRLKKQDLYRRMKRLRHD